MHLRHNSARDGKEVELEESLFKKNHNCVQKEQSIQDSNPKFHETFLMYREYWFDATTEPDLCSKAPIVSKGRTFLALVCRCIGLSLFMNCSHKCAYF